MRFTDEELSLIKNTFGENLVLLKGLRKHFLQEETTPEVGALSKESLKVLRKTFLPTIDTDAPIHQTIDLLLTVDMKEKGVEELYNALHSRKILIDYLEQELSALEGKKVTRTITFNNLSKIEGKTPEQLFQDMHARNTLIIHVEQQLGQLEVLAGTKDETPEEMKKRLTQNSAK